MEQPANICMRHVRHGNLRQGKKEEEEEVREGEKRKEEQFREWDRQGQGRKSREKHGEEEVSYGHRRRIKGRVLNRTRIGKRRESSLEERRVLKGKTRAWKILGGKGARLFLLRWLVPRKGLWGKVVHPLLPNASTHLHAFKTHGPVYKPLQDQFSWVQGTLSVTNKDLHLSTSGR